MAKKKRRNGMSLQHEPWTPFVETHYAPEREAMLKEATKNSSKKYLASFSNNLYQVEMALHLTTMGELLWLSIVRKDRKAIHDWRHLQRIKNELCGPEREAIELYPQESRLVDTNNQYHLFVLPEGMITPVGYAERDVSNIVDGTKHKQRPFQEPPRDLNARDKDQLGIAVYGPSKPRDTNETE